MTKNKAKQPRFSRAEKNYFIVLGILLSVVVVYDFVLPRNISFYAKWVSCGQRPVGSRGSGLFNVGVPHYEKVELLRILHGHIDYYCTPLEAERAGYSANPEVFDYPHLKAIGEYRKQPGEW